ncbi:MAG: CopG family transcriptional regulator [Spirochaetia bacterium]|jgi:metal-responsive CopG/Arc/MetJ family transcriptional regulator
MKRIHDHSVRVSITFPEAHYLELERLSSMKKVSVAWVVRDAVEAYLKRETPLFDVDDIAQDPKSESRRMQHEQR